MYKESWGQMTEAETFSQNVEIAQIKRTEEMEEKNEKDGMKETESDSTTVPNSPSEGQNTTPAPKPAIANRTERPDDRFGRWLKQYRNRMGLTRAALARRINYSVDAIKKVENGQRVPSESMARLLAEALGITPELHGVFIRFGRTNNSHPAFARLVQRDDIVNSDQLPPAPTTPNPTRHIRLPYPVKPIVDRVDEIKVAVELITQKNVRLLTLHGAPGVGKTRLGLEISNLLRGSFEDHVFYVSLSPVNSPEGVPSEIALQLHLPAQDLRRMVSAALPDILVEALRHRRTLLVLDNFEHVLSASGLISYLLEQTPSLVIIITSREALGLADEMPLEVPCLSFPSSAQASVQGSIGLDLNAAANYAAIKMFVQEARTHDAGFNLTDSNYEQVRAICEQLQGLPLGLELAAGQLAHSPLAELHTQLQQNHSVRPLSHENGRNTLPSHHMNLVQAIQWSYQKLKPIEQQLFTAACIFAAPVDEQALQAVAFDANGLLETSMLPYVLRTLCDKHLLQQDLLPGRINRYTMMTPIRNALRETIVAKPLLETLQLRQVNYFEQLANRPENKINHPGNLEWGQQIDHNYHNLIAALDWCYINEPNRALHMAANLANYWKSRGHWHEGRRWLDRLIQTNGNTIPIVPANVRARALGALATFQMLQGEPITAIDTANKSLALAEGEQPDNETAIERGSALTVLGDANYLLDDYAHAVAQYERALEVYRKIGARWYEANLLGQMGYMAHDQGDLSSADRLINQSLIIWHGLANQVGIASALQRLAQLELLRGRSERASELAQQSLTLCRKQEDRLGEAIALQRLGAAWLQMGQLDRAEGALSEAVAQLQMLNSGISLAEALTSLGRTLQLQGRIPEAIKLHRMAIELAEQLRNRRVVSANLSFLAGALMGQNQPVTAAKLLATATKLTPTGNSAISNVTARHAEVLKIEVRRHLSPLNFDTAWEEGLALNLNQALSIV